MVNVLSVTNAVVWLVLFQEEQVTGIKYEAIAKQRNVD